MRQLGCCNVEGGKQNEKNQTLDFVEEEAKMKEDTPKKLIDEEYFRNQDWNAQEMVAVLKVQSAYRGL